ncbi:MAG: tRNA 2-thiouridine(34) synthase MnmA [Bacteroidales bacterium]|nr:tRNA 2-thiouridine(34) synthase MnmA [Bacteroidales bacterium]
MKKRVIVGLSGGVDSSVAAWLLKEQGYDVAGLFMQNWHDTAGLLQGECHAEDDVMFAEMTAKKTGIPFHFVDLSADYRQNVVDYMFSEYEKGRTPNPDVLCNREIKFQSFAAEARRLGGDWVATGHYCRRETVSINNTPVNRLLAGIDGNKDQSYFLCQLSQEQLSNALFPLGGYTKPEVRAMAHELGLPTAQRKDSQGICFIGKIHLPTFLQQKMDARRGKIIEITDRTVFPEIAGGLPPSDASTGMLALLASPYVYAPESGKVIGEHNGAHFYTVGQRKGMNIGGYAEPLFVIATDTVRNIIYTGEGHSHPGLNRKGLLIKPGEIHWIRRDMELGEGESHDFMVRIRYRQPLQKARLFRRKEGMFIIFDELQRGIAPGQFAAWYSNDEVIGSGVIDS